MEKPVNINGKELTFKCSAAIPRMYRKEYNADLFADFKYISEIPEGDMDSKA